MPGVLDEIQSVAVPVMFESGLVTLSSIAPSTPVLAAVGAFSCADLYVSLPSGGPNRFWIHLFGRVGDVRFLIATVDGRDLVPSVDGARQGCLVFSVRGRPCSAFEVECDPDVTLTDFNFFLQAWNASTPQQVSIGAHPMPVQRASSSRATFSAASDRLLTLATAANSSTILGALWNASTTGKRVELQRIELSFWGASTSGSVRIRSRRLITAPAGGSSLTAQRHDEGGPGASAGFSVVNTVVAFPANADFIMLVLKPSQVGTWVWTASDAGKPIVLRAGQSEGFEVRAVTDVAMASAMTFGMSIQWVEI